MTDRTTEKSKMLAGRLYRADDPVLVADRAAAAHWMERYNRTIEVSDRASLLRERLAAVGEGAEIRPPFHCDYGYNIRIGAGAFLNFGCVILDVVAVSVGDGSQIGPGVQILAADHPREPALRAQMLEFGRPVTIGRNV